MATTKDILQRFRLGGMQASFNGKDMMTIPKESFDSLTSPDLGEVSPTVAERKPGFLERTSNVLTKVFPGKKLGEAIGTSIAATGRFLAGDKAGAKDILETQVSPREVGGDVAGAVLTAGTLGGAGVVGSFTSRLLTMMGLGAGLSASQALSEDRPTEDVLKSGVGGAAVGAALPVAGAGLRVLGNQIRQLPARFINSALSRKKADVLKDIAKDKVDDFAKFVLENKPIGTANKLLGESVDSIIALSGKIANSLSQAARQVGGKITVGRDNLLDDVAKLPEATGALLKRADIRGIVERLSPQAKRLLQQESWTLTEANQLRQLVDRTLGDRAFLGAQLSSDKAVLRGFANSLRELVKNKAPEGTRALFSELSNEIRFRDGLLDRVAAKAGNQVLSFGDFIGGGLGGIFGGGLPGAVAGVATGRVIESVPFKLSAAKVTNALTKLEPVIEQLTPAQQTAILTFFADVFSGDNQTQDQQE